MNKIIRHFLPSQVRGVYRFDETFSLVSDDAALEQFTESKLRFLPCSLIEPIRRCVDLEEGIANVKQQVALPAVPRNNAASQRAKFFFEQHDYFQNALEGESAINGAENYLEVHFVKKILAPLLNKSGLAAVQPQKQIGPYFVDFAIESHSKLVLEIDGFGKFQSRNDLDKFIVRQNYIVSQGWRILRFTYGQIMDKAGIAKRGLHDILAAEPELNSFLLQNATPPAQPHPVTLFDFFRPQNQRKPNVLDLVNGFYRCQDWFVQFALEKTDTEEIVLRDELGFPLPMVALAVSSLYHFLDAVATVVNIDFDLPAVKVSTSEMSSSWEERLRLQDIGHPSVKVIRRILKKAEPVTPLSLKQRAFSLPTPLQSDEHLSFRTGLEIDEIHQGLRYITREVFGYDNGTNPFQDQVLQRIFNGQETLGISTTGSGKSFCFWLPALLRPGLSIIIAPLRSLMRDQRLTLLNYGVASMEFINSDVEGHEQRRFMEEAKLGYLRLLYISPERLRIKKFVNEIEKLQKFVTINLLAIDEAHCLSEWGHDFRPSYLKIPIKRTHLAASNPGLRFVALTATAGALVEKDMLNVLKLADSDVIRTSMADREYFSYQTVTLNDGESKTAAFQKIVQEDLARALQQPSLPALLEHRNSRQEKAVGITFCIYADPHGKDTVKDGTCHYLFETMQILEPGKVFQAGQTREHPQYNPEAFATGRVRAFSSKPPKLCPQCYSYAYTSRGRNAVTEDDPDNPDNQATGRQPAGQKVCQRCGHVFLIDSAISLHPGKKWEELINQNQLDFKKSDFDILVATKGFGMGIDKSSVRFVIHTSLSSGLESWYQEVGRAGRDNERAHIVLLVDVPNAQCKKAMSGANPTMGQPQCSYQGGCSHGRQSLCDYGKQHIFITKSYPGIENDAIYALRILDNIFHIHGQTGEHLIPVRFRYGDEISRSELALYRLLTLGLIKDYTVVYGQSPHFEVELGIDVLPERVNTLKHHENVMHKYFESYLSQKSRTRISYEKRLDRIQDKTPLTSLNLTRFRLLPVLKTESLQYAFFETVYKYLLLILDYVYDEVVTMRYDMLWNLYGVVNSAHDKKCQRVNILPYFEGIDSIAEDYQCGCCNVCAPTLDFLEKVRTRPQSQSNETNRNELYELLRNNQLDIPKLRHLCEVFRDYRTDMYVRGRAALEGDPHNLPALYLTRHFSPLSELAANTKRLLRTANMYNVPVGQLRELYTTSASELQSETLLLLNEEHTACDCPEGWTFLAEEADLYQHAGNEQIAVLRDCLELFLLVESLPEDTESLKEKAFQIEELLDA